MPIITNIATARSVSIEAPAITRSFIRFTMKLRLRSTASSHPPGNSASSTRGNSGYRKTEIASRAIPSATSAPYSAEPESIAWWIKMPALSSAAMIPNEIIPAPPMAKATGKPDMMPPKRHINTINRPTSIPSNPKIICLPLSGFLPRVPLPRRPACLCPDICLRKPHPRRIRGSCARKTHRLAGTHSRRTRRSAP